MYTLTTNSRFNKHSLFHDFEVQVFVWLVALKVTHNCATSQTAERSRETQAPVTHVSDDTKYAMLAKVLDKRTTHVSTLHPAILLNGASFHSP